MRDSVKIGVASGLCVFIVCFSLFYAYEPLLEKGIKSEHMPAWLQAFGSVFGLFVAFWFGRSDVAARNAERAAAAEVARLEGEILIQRNISDFMSVRRFCLNFGTSNLYDQPISEKMIRFWDEYSKITPPDGELILKLSKAYGPEVLKFHKGLMSLKVWSEHCEKQINPDVLRTLISLNRHHRDERAILRIEERFKRPLRLIDEAVENIRSGGDILWKPLEDYPLG